MQKSTNPSLYHYEFPFLLVALLFFISPLKAVYSGKQIPLSIVYDKNRGLPDQTIYDLLLDKSGFIWLATESGLYRFDGQNFKSYRSDLQNSLAGSSLLQDNLGRIWYENFDGFLFYVENDTLKSLPDQSPNAFIPIALNSSQILVHKNSKIINFSINTLKPTYTFPFSNHHISDVSSFEKTSVLADSNQFILINGKNFKFLNPGKHNATAPFRIHYVNDELFFASKNNESGFIYHYVNNKLSPISISLRRGRINKIQSIGNLIFVLSTNGLFLLSKSNNTWKELGQFFPGTNILSILKDKAGAIWLGTAGQGLLNIPDFQKQIISFPPNFGLNRFQPISTGFLASSFNGELYILDSSLNIREKVYQDPDSLPFISFFYDEKEALLFLSSKYSVVYNTAKKKIIATHPYSQKDVCKVDNQYYLIGTSNSAYLVKNPNLTDTHSSWNEYYELNKIENILNHATLKNYVRVRGVANIPDSKKVLLATNKGLFFCSPKANFQLKFKNKPLFIQSLFVSRNKIWALSQKGELFTIQAIPNSNNLLISCHKKLNQILAIKKTHNGILILKSEACSLLNENSMEEIAQFQIHSYGLQLFDANLLGIELILLTNKGWLKKKLNSIELERPDWFSVYSINGKETKYNPNSNFTLPWNKNQIDIQFLWFPGTGPISNSIEYKINQNNWVRLEAETRELHLEALIPGDYTITFRTGGKIWNEKQINFSVQKPFWLQPAFFLILLGSLIGIMVLYYNKRLKTIHARNKLLTEHLTLEKELNQSRLASIRAQMNPHFFYNALNTIQAYIFQKDPENAIDYLNKFAKLTRMILDFSEKESVTLENELIALKMYLELEKMRFANQFDYLINCEVLDTEMVKIPSMIIQPYVENAIKHGLMHIKTGRKLSLSIHESKNYLEVIVDDNGIGRKKAGELNQIKSNKHQSFSTTATEKRLTILNKGLNKKVLIEYTDKTNSSGNSLGTTVLIRIPIYQ